MRMVDIIEKKRNGEELLTEEIRFFVEGYTNGKIPDYQASALCMAIYFQDMTDRERADLTMAMVESGDQIDLSAIAGMKMERKFLQTVRLQLTTLLQTGNLVQTLSEPLISYSY